LICPVLQGNGGRHERPHIDPTTKHNDSIRGCDWIGHDLKIGRAPKQGRSLDPSNRAQGSQYKNNYEMAAQSGGSRTLARCRLNVNGVNRGTLC
jgi:hypothetical protein